MVQARDISEMSVQYTFMRLHGIASQTSVFFM